MIRLYRIECASLRYIICMLRMVLITQSLVSFRHRIFGLRYPLQAPPTPSHMVTTQLLSFCKNLLLSVSHPTHE